MGEEDKKKTEAEAEQESEAKADSGEKKVGKFTHGDHMVTILL